MELTWDEAKRASNLAKHGVDFADAAGFDWTMAVSGEDARKEYGEHRLIAVGAIGTVIHVLIFTLRGDVVRVISLRKASRKERARYEKEKQSR